MFSPSKDKIDGVYGSLQANPKIKYYVDINKYPIIELYILPDG